MAKIANTWPLDASASTKPAANGMFCALDRFTLFPDFRQLTCLLCAAPLVGRKSLDAQPVTHYHSFFAELLSWKNPRELFFLSQNIAYLKLAAV